MIPNTTTIETKGATLLWTNSNFMITVDEAKAISKKIELMVKSPGVNSVMVDNRSASGTWPQNLAEVWNPLMKTIVSNTDKCATVASSLINSMQINRIARTSGTAAVIKAFGPTEYIKAEKFIKSLNTNS